MHATQAAFRALADPTRRQILLDLSQRDMTIAEVAQQFDITRGAVRKHLTILEQGQLISVHTVGRARINRLQPAGLRAVAEWIDYFSQYWDQNLQRLQRAVEQKP